jgi:cell division protein FtsL
MLPFSHEFLKKSSFILILLSLLMGIGLYHLKHRVSNTARELHETRIRILDLQESLHTLKAEWGFLTSPKRLAKLSNQHLKLQPVKAIQIASLDTINQRATKGIMVAYRRVP